MDGVYEWHRQIQIIVDEIDRSIKNCDDEALTLSALARRLGYSEYHTRANFGRSQACSCGTICAAESWLLR